MKKLLYILFLITNVIISQDRFVNETAIGSGDGLSDATAWTLQQSTSATAGMTVYIKSGDYNITSKLNYNNSGTSSSHIKIVGYTTNVNDIISQEYSTFADDDLISNSNMPNISGSSLTTFNAIEINGDYVEFHNILVTNSNIAFQIDGNNNTIDNCVAKELGSVGDLDYTGRGFVILGDSNTITNSHANDCTAEGFFDEGFGNTFSNNYAYATTNHETDYMFVMKGDGTGGSVTNSKSKRDWTGGHGSRVFCIKSGSNYNVNGVIGYNSAIQINRTSSFNNTIENFELFGERSQISFNNGAHDNIVKNGTVEGDFACVVFNNNAENDGDGDKMPDDNLVMNTIFTGTGRVFQINDDVNLNTSTLSATGNKILNCVFDGQNLGLGQYVNITDFTVRNSIFINQTGNLVYNPNSHTGSITYEYCNFFNSSNTPSAANITSLDPLFVSATDYHLQSNSGVINIGVADPDRILDFEGNVIAGLPDLGAYEYQTNTGTPTVILNTLKAFPDAWGERAEIITGGRGGVKFFITDLSDSSIANFVSATASTEEHYTGTLRGSLNTGIVGMQIIPRISGNTVATSSMFTNTGGNFGYHGHLAPEGGFAFTNSRMWLGEMDNVSIRFLKARVGKDVTTNYDALTIWGDWTKGGIVDHSSFAWAADETFSVGFDDVSKQTTVISQYNIIGQCIDGHNTGSIIGKTNPNAGYGGEVNWHKNVYVGVTHRTPNFAGDTDMYGRIYNNVIYDWQYRLTNLVGAPTVDVAYNYYKKGPNSGSIATYERNVYQELQSTHPHPPSIFTEGNYIPGDFTDLQADNQILWNYFDTSHNPLPSSLFRNTRLSVSPNFGYEPITALEAYQELIIDREVGANRSVNSSGDVVVSHDSVDEYYLDAIENGTNPRTVQANWNHPSIPSNSFYTDTNWNGIPDSFETTHGINDSGDIILNWDLEPIK